MKTFELDEFLFHYICEYGITVLCMTDKKFERKLSFAFLQDVKKQLLESYTQRDLQNAGPNQLGTFNQNIKDKIVSSSPHHFSFAQSQCVTYFLQEFWNSNPVGHGDKTDQLVNQLKSLNEQMQENLTQSLLRGEKIELVNERSESLMKTSTGYLATTSKVKR